MNFKDFFKFSLHPTPFVERNVIGFKQTFILSLLVFATILVFVLFLCVLFIVPLKIFGSLPERKPINITTLNIIIITIIAPICEELIFRLPLIKKKHYLVISMVFLSFLLVNRYSTWAMSVVAAILIGLLLVYIIYYSKVKIYYNKLYNNNFSLVFYLSIVIFGFLHINNYSGINFNNLIFLPLLVSIQLFSAFLFSYVRLKYNTGLLICMISHILMNTFFVLPKLF